MATTGLCPSELGVPSRWTVLDALTFARHDGFLSVGEAQERCRPAGLRCRPGAVLAAELLQVDRHPCPTNEGPASACECACVCV